MLPRNSAICAPRIQQVQAQSTPRREMQTKRACAIFGVVLTLVLLVVGTCTSALIPVLKALPPHADLFFHGFAHALFVVAAALCSPRAHPIAIYSTSTALACAIEAVQGMYVRGRQASYDDIIAAAVGSLVVFVVHPTMKMMRRTPSALTEQEQPLPV